MVTTSRDEDTLRGPLFSQPQLPKIILLTLIWDWCGISLREPPTPDGRQGLRPGAQRRPVESRWCRR